MSQIVQGYAPRIPEKSQAQRELEKADIETMMGKGAISQIDHTQTEFLRFLFFEAKEGWVSVQ